MSKAVVPNLFLPMLHLITSKILIAPHVVIHKSYDLKNKPCFSWGCLKRQYLGLNKLTKNIASMKMKNEVNKRQLKFGPRPRQSNSVAPLKSQIAHLLGTTDLEWRRWQICRRNLRLTWVSIRDQHWAHNYLSLLVKKPQKNAEREALGSYSMPMTWC